MSLYISHPSLVIYFFGNPTNETRTRTANRRGTTNSQTTWINHYDGPIRNTEQQSDHIFYTLFCRCTELLPSPFTSHCKRYNYAEPKPFSCIFMGQTAIFLTFRCPIVVCKITYSAPLEMLLARIIFCTLISSCFRTKCNGLL